jgi:hypothetical protein
LSTALQRSESAELSSQQTVLTLERRLSLMNNNQNGHSTLVVVFGAALLLAILGAAVTTFERSDTRTAVNDTAPGTTGLAQPHPPLDRAPGQPVINN